MICATEEVAIRYFKLLARRSSDLQFEYMKHLLSGVDSSQKNKCPVCGDNNKTMVNLIIF